MKNFIAMIQETKNFMNTIDFTQFLPAGNYMELDEIISNVEQYYDVAHPELLPKKFGGHIFNYLTSYEVGEYLGKRYGWHLNEVSKYYLIR